MIHTPSILPVSFLGLLPAELLTLIGCYCGGPVHFERVAVAALCTDYNDLVVNIDVLDDHDKQLHRLLRAMASMSVGLRAHTLFVPQMSSAMPFRVIDAFAHAVPILRAMVHDAYHGFVCSRQIGNMCTGSLCIDRIVYVMLMYEWLPCPLNERDLLYCICSGESPIPLLRYVQRGGRLHWTYNSATGSNLSALFLATYPESIDIARLLVQLGLDPLTEYPSDNLIHACSQRANPLGVRFYAGLGVSRDFKVPSVDEIEMDGEFIPGPPETIMTDQCWLVMKTDKRFTSYETILALVDIGVDINGQNGRGYTLLMITSIEAPLDDIEFLLRLGADPRCVGKDGATVLHCAAKNRLHPDVLSYFLAMKPVLDVNALWAERIGSPHSALALYLYTNSKDSNHDIIRADIIRAFLENGADMNLGHPSAMEVVKRDYSCCSFMENLFALAAADTSRVYP